MSNLSVAHVSNVIGGGMGTVFRVLLPAQARLGDRVSFFVRAAGDDDLAYFTAQGVEMHRVTSALDLARRLRRYDVVHLHSADLDLLLAGWLSRRPTVFTLHGLRAQTRGISELSLRRLPTFGGVRRRLKRVGLSLLLRHAMTRVTTVSEFLAGKAVTLYGVDPARVTVVRSGIALERFKDAGRRGGGRGRTIGWVGRLVPVKRVDMLLRALSSVVSTGSCPGVRAIVVGDGPLKDDLVALAGSLGIGTVVDFTGFVEKPEDYFAQMDLFVLPSREEGAGLVIDEAMAAGLPVMVLADGGGAAEQVQRSGGGVIVPDEEALAGEIATLLGNDDTRRELAERGAAYASRELDPAVWAARFDDVYRATIAAPGR